MLSRLIATALLCCVASAAWAESPTTAPTTRLFNGWGLTPAGTHLRVSDLPLKMVFSPDRKTLAAVCAGLNPALALIDVKGRSVNQILPLERSFNGVAFSSDGARIYVTGGNSDLIYVFAFVNGKATLQKRVELVAPGAAPATQPAALHGTQPEFLAGIALHPQTGKLYICNEARGEIWTVNPDSLQVEASTRVGLYPHSCIVGANPRFLYVSHWGERTVGVVDLQAGKLIARVPVGIRPNDLAVAPDGRLFVACAGDNTVHAIRTRWPREESRGSDESAPPPQFSHEIIATSLYPASPEGSTPAALAISPDGRALVVANADNNDVALIDISDEKVSRVVGFIPTGWYPSAIACDEQTIFVANGKGLSSRANYPAQNVGKAARTVGGAMFDSENGCLEGWVSLIEQPTGQQLIEYTEQVRKNSPYTPQSLGRAVKSGDSVIPDRVGQPCPIKHVLYIIKENRTYDQVFGDMTDASGKRIGNGEPKITMFGESITPNQHQLARDYVLLDNLYCNGEVSADGHSWCDAAMATDFKQRTWMARYTQHGEIPGNEDMNSPAAGYLWDLCKRGGVSFKCYGEGEWDVPNDNRGSWTGGRDMDRVAGWIKDLHDAEQTGNLPQFMIMSLGENHTQGTTPGAHTPQACVASNDIGVGKIVQAATRSKFWKEMAIFIIEDDAQNGPDHVDAHRTIGLVISPYVKRGVVDSTPYTTTSMVRTIELILGLGPMTQYDAGATPMFNCFDKEARLTEYNPLQPNVDLFAKNAETAPGAKASAAMDFDEYDRAPEDELNRILWVAVKGPDEPYPIPIHRAVFTR